MMSEKTTEQKPMNVKVEKEQETTLQCDYGRCCELINDIRETLSQIPAKALKDIFLLYDRISSLDPCTENLKNATGLLLGLKGVWETPLPGAKQ